MAEGNKTIQLDREQIDLILSVLREKRNELDVILKNQDGLEAETIRDLLIEHRDIGNVIRELQFFAIM